MSATEREITLAMIRGSLNALQVVFDIMSEMQDAHDEAPIGDRYELMLSNWVRLQLELLNEANDLKRQVSELGSPFPPDNPI